MLCMQYIAIVSLSNFMDCYKKMLTIRLLVLIVLIQWSTSGHRTAASKTTKILYVVSDNNSNCSSLCSSVESKSDCHPLSFYVKEVSNYFTNNTKMIFMAGTHHLHLPHNSTPVVNITGISNFSMIGHGNVTFNQSEEDAPLPSSIISCSYSSTNQPRNGILFYKTNAIRIENLTIEHCGAMFTVHGPDNFTLVSALTFRESYNINLTQVRIDSSLGFGLDANRVFGLFRVCLLYTSPSPRDATLSRMPSSA